MLAPLGLRRENLLGRNLWVAFVGLQHSPLGSDLRRAMQVGNTVSSEVFAPPLSTWFEVRAYPSPEGLALYVQDITRRKADQQALIDGNARLQLALSAGRLGDWHWDAASDRITLGERAASMFGLPAEQALSWAAVHARLDRQDRVSVRRAVLQAFAARGELNQECRLTADDGTVRWITLVGRADYADPGQREDVLGMTGVVQDISVRKHTEDSLRQSEEMLRGLANSIPQLAWMAQPDGAIVWFNERWYEYTGSTPDEVSGWGWQAMHDPQVLPAMLEHWHASLRTGEPFEMEFPLRGANGKYRWFLTRVNAVRDRSGRIVRWFGTSTDVDEVKRAERALREAADERKVLLESERLARAEAERTSQMKDEFLATLSHELRTPLSAILGWAQVLRRGSRDQDDLQRGLQTIERNARVQAQLIEDLLDMSRIASGKVLLDMQPLAPAAVIDAAIETVRPAADARTIRLETRYDPAAGLIAGDAGRLQQVIWNLLANAIKFTPRGGQVTVELARGEGLVSITVRDTGAGIRPEFITHVFERFRQADASTTRRHGGLGLGLAIVRHLVEQHGGTVRAESAGEGMGASFTIELPLARQQAAGRSRTGLAAHRFPAPATPDLMLRDLSGVRILVVDDDRDARELIARILADCNASVSTAASAREGLAAVRKAAPDLLISDLGMPEADGFELLSRVRALGPECGGNVPALALTAFARSEDRLRALEAGFSDHISKPVEPSELIAAVAGIALPPGHLPAIRHGVDRAR
jgi:PAS domain S-box-containing protein